MLLDGDRLVNIIREEISKEEFIVERQEEDSEDMALKPDEAKKMPYHELVDLQQAVYDLFEKTFDKPVDNRPEEQKSLLATMKVIENEIQSDEKQKQKIAFDKKIKKVEE